MNDTAYLAIENTLAVISLILWTVQLIPQIWHQYKLHQQVPAEISLQNHGSVDDTTTLELHDDTKIEVLSDPVSDDKKEIAWGMLASWIISSALLNPFITYVHLTIPLVLQAHSFTILLVLMILQHVYYQAKEPKSSTSSINEEDGMQVESAEDLQVKKRLLPRISPIVSVLLVLMILLVILISSEVGLYFALQSTQDTQQGWHTFLIYLTSVFPSLMILCGFIPQILQIITAKSAKTLSRYFVWFDFMGGAFGLAALALSSKDRLEGDKEFWYSSALYIGVMIGHLVFISLIVKYDGASTLIPSRQKIVHDE